MAKKESRRMATIADYKRVFGTPHGKKVLRDLMNQHMLVTSHVEGDPYSTAFREGGRNMVIYILKNIKFNLVALEKELTKVEEQDEYVE
jgi:hypothetical protein